MQEALKEQLAREEEARRRVAEVRANRKFMAGVHEALACWQRGEKGVPSKNLKRKHGRS